MPTHAESVAIDLIAMTQTGLHDSLAPRNLPEETMHVGNEIGVDVTEVSSDNGTEQQASEAGRRLDREHEVAERDTSSGSVRSRMPHLELGQQHAGNAR